MMVMMVVLVFVFVVVVMVMTAAVGIIALVLVMMMVMLRSLCQTRKLLLNGVATLHGSQKLCAVELLPRGGHDRSGRVMLAQQCHGLGDLFLADTLRVGEDDTARIFNLVVKELAKVLHIHLAFFHVCHGGKAVEDHVIGRDVLHRADNVGQLANARRLDQNTVGVILVKHFAECLAKVAHERATDATAVHFGDLDPRVLHKTAVNTDLTELVFDQHQLLARIGFR